MKKFIYLITLLFALSSSLTVISCREDKTAGERMEEGVEDVEEGAEEVGDEIEEGAEEVEDAVDDNP